MNSEVSQLLAKADRSVNAAKRLLADGDLDFCASRAYYAMFYGVEALLLTKNLTASSHSGSLTLFYEHFIRAGILTKDLHKDFHWAFELRQQGDYWIDPGITQALAEMVCTKATAFLKAVKNHLK